jgi:hypothetical protein
MVGNTGFLAEGTRPQKALLATLFTSKTGCLGDSCTDIGAHAEAATIMSQLAQF